MDRDGAGTRFPWVILAVVVLLYLMTWTGLDGGVDCSCMELGRDLAMNPLRHLRDALAGRWLWMVWALSGQALGLDGLGFGALSLPGALAVGWLAWRWGSVLGGAALARTALLASGLFPLLSHYATLAYPETTAAALVGVAATLLLLPGWKERPGAPWLAGLSLGAAMLFHESCLVPAALLLALLGDRRRALRCGAVLLAVWGFDWAVKASLDGDPLHVLHCTREVTGSAHRQWYPSKFEILRRVTWDWWGPHLWPWHTWFPRYGGFLILAGIGWALGRRRPLVGRLGAWLLLSLAAWDLFPAPVLPYLPILDAGVSRITVPIALPWVLLAGLGLVELCERGWGGKAIAAALSVTALLSSFRIAEESQVALSVPNAAAAWLERAPAAPVWTDTVNRRLLKALMPGSRERILPLDHAFDPETARGFVLWDPRAWRPGTAPPLGMTGPPPVAWARFGQLSRKGDPHPEAPAVMYLFN